MPLPALERRSESQSPSKQATNSDHANQRSPKSSDSPGPAPLDAKNRGIVREIVDDGATRAIRRRETYVINPADKRMADIRRELAEPAKKMPETKKKPGEDAPEPDIEIPRR